MTEAKNYNELALELEKLAKEHGINLSDYANAIAAKDKNDKLQEIRKNIEDNRIFVGKYFRYDMPFYDLYGTLAENGRKLQKQTLYVKVLSNYSINDHSVECLVFPKKPGIKKEKKIYKEYRLGCEFWQTLKADTFTVESMDVAVVRTMTEIGKEEYEKAAQKFVDALLSISCDSSEEEWI